jgi:hypothetical protein
MSWFYRFVTPKKFKFSESLITLTVSYCETSTLKFIEPLLDIKHLSFYKYMEITDIDSWKDGLFHLLKKNTALGRVLIAKEAHLFIYIFVHIRFLYNLCRVSTHNYQLNAATLTYF